MSGVRTLRLTFAAPIARRCWKHSQQTPGHVLASDGTHVVSLPHCEQVVFRSERIGWRRHSAPLLRRLPHASPCTLSALGLVLEALVGKKHLLRRQ